MKKIDITIQEITENYFLRDDKKLKLVFTYDYFEDFITRNGLQDIFSKKIYINGFDFEMVKLGKVDFNSEFENTDFITKLQTNIETHISEGLLYLGNDKSRKFGFFFFPNYFEEGDIKNDFISIKSNEKIDLIDYVSFRGLFKRNGVVVALKI